MRKPLGFLFFLFMALPSMALVQAMASVPLDLHFANSGSAAAQKRRTGSLKITITDMEGGVVSGARVQVVGKMHTAVVTNQDGIATVDSLSPGKYTVSVASRGFRPREISGVEIAIGREESLLVKLELAPPTPADIRSYQTLDPHLYSDFLHTLKEPGLCREPVPSGIQRYRFFWLPTFYHPVSMRVDIQKDGTGTLEVKILSGQGGYGLGKVQTTTTRKLPWNEEATLFTTLADIGFWKLPARVDDPYTTIPDGTGWVIEGIRDGNCHAIARYSSPLTNIFIKYFLGGVGHLKPYNKGAAK